jgi:hypothetical protein
MRPEIGKQWIGDPAQAFRPGVQAIFTVDADTQDLGIYPVEPVESDLVRRDLRRSYGCPGQREKGQDNIFSPQIVAQANFFAVLVFQHDIWGILSDF